MKQKTVPKEELNDENIKIIDKISQFCDESWMAPAVEGEDEDYLNNIFLAPNRNHPEHFEFMNDYAINLDPSSRLSINSDIPKTPLNDPSQRPKSALQGKVLDPKRILINPRFMTNSLKTVTYRFVLVLECEYRVNAPNHINLVAPNRFSVSEPTASKDPRSVRLNQLIGVSNKNPETQFPSGNIYSYY
jgi:hypothetical protein